MDAKRVRSKERSLLRLDTSVRAEPVGGRAQRASEKRRIDDGRNDRRTYGTTAEGQTGQINTPSLMNLFVGNGSEGDGDGTESDAW